MRLLDLFCGAGGAAMGYHRAGFEVVGVDHVPQKRYPFEFHQADAMTYPLDGFDAIHASPPCIKFSMATIPHLGDGAERLDLLTPTRERLRAWGGVWVIENVVGSPLDHGIVLCGLMFGLKVFRHRVFESSHILFAPGHPSHSGKRIGHGYYSVAGGSGKYKNWAGVQTGVTNGPVSKWREAMDIDWMVRKELVQSIPPAYTEYIGRQLRSFI